MIGIDTHGPQTDPRIEEEEKEFWCTGCEEYITEVSLDSNGLYCNVCTCDVEED